MTGNSGSAECEPHRKVVVSNLVSGGTVKGVQSGTVTGDITITEAPAATELAPSTEPAILRRNGLPPAARRWTPEPADLALLSRVVHEVLTGTQPTPLVVISGACGVGKTQLALRWAQLNAGMFLGGCLFADAGPMIAPNGEELPAALTDILADWLHRVGAAPVTAQPAQGVRPYSDAWISHTERLPPMLTVVDDVVSAAQVRCLLHGGLTLATSRRRLSGLWANGARFLAYEESGWVHVQT